VVSYPLGRRRPPRLRQYYNRRNNNNSSRTVRAREAIRFDRHVSKIDDDIVVITPTHVSGRSGRFLSVRRTSPWPVETAVRSDILMGFFCPGKRDASRVTQQAVQVSSLKNVDPAKRNAPHNSIMAVNCNRPGGRL